MDYLPINISEKLGKFSDHWAPRVIAEMNDYQFKLVKFSGEFVWHDHQDTDEVFIVLSGTMEIQFRDGTAHLGEGEMFVIKKGIEHRTRASTECHALLVEPRGVTNTGNAGGVLTAVNDAWV